MYLAISEGTNVFPTPNLVLYHINIMPSPYFSPRNKVSKVTHQKIVVNPVTLS